MLMEVDMDADDYTKAIGEANGKFEQVVSLIGDLSRDFDSKENVFSYIDQDGRF